VKILSVGHRASIRGEADVVESLDIGTKGCNACNSLLDALTSGCEMFCRKG
jgi:hypothetical protein